MAGYQLRKREVYDRLRAKLHNDRSSFIGHWQAIADATKPRRLRLTTSDRNQGDKRNQAILDNTPTTALRTLASGLLAGMSSPARVWFKLTTPDPALAEREHVKQWLYDVEQRMYAVMGLTNYYNAVGVLLGDSSTFGTGAMAIVEDDEDLLRCYPFPLGSYALGLDRRKRVCTFVLDDQWSVRQVVEEFGEFNAEGTLTNRETFSQLVLNAWDKKSYEDNVEVCWVVMPNEHANPDKLDAKYKAYTSCWFEPGRNEDKKDHQAVLRESGFNSFPIMAPRWEVTNNDSYGTDCPGMLLLGDANQLQGMTRKMSQLLAKSIDPPLVGPSSLKGKDLSLIAGHFNADDARDSKTGLRPLHEIRLEGYQHLLAQIEAVRLRIRDAAFYTLFRQFSSQPFGAQPMTAAEVRERHAESVLELGPALERHGDELYDPSIDRFYQVMDDNGLIPPPPQELEGVKLRVEYVSVLAEAQKLVKLVGIDRLMASIVPLAEYAPDVLDKIDFLAVASEYAASLGVNPKLMRTDDDARARGEARAQAAAQAQAAEDAAKVGTAVRNVASAPMDTNNALTQLMGAPA